MKILFLLIYLVVLGNCKNEEKPDPQVIEKCFLKVDMQVKREYYEIIRSLDFASYIPIEWGKYYKEIGKNEFNFGIFKYLKPGDLLEKIDECQSEEVYRYNVDYFWEKFQLIPKFEYILAERNYEKLKQNVKKIYIVRNGKQVVLEISELKLE